VTGATTLAAVSATSATISGAATVGTTLGVTGATTLAAVSATSATISGAATVGTTLGVTGATTLAGVSATSATISGAATVGTTLGVTGATTLAAVSATSATISGAATVGTTLGVTGATTLTGGVTVGSGGTAYTLVKTYTPSLTPASVAQKTSAEQTFAVAGLAVGDTVFVSPPGITPDCLVGAARVSAANTIAIQFSNPNNSTACTPTAGTYRIVAFR
jgi:hypothetical protein